MVMMQNNMWMIHAQDDVHNDIDDIDRSYTFLFCLYTFRLNRHNNGLHMYLTVNGCIFFIEFTVIILCILLLFELLSIMLTYNHFHPCTNHKN